MSKIHVIYFIVTNIPLAMYIVVNWFYLRPRQDACQDDSTRILDMYTKAANILLALFVIQYTFNCTIHLDPSLASIYESTLKI